MKSFAIRRLRAFGLYGCAAWLAAALPGGTARALTVTAVTSDNGYPAHQVQWTDAEGLPRTAVLVDQNATGAGPYTGYLRQYIYQVDGQTRTCTGTDNYAAGGNLEFSGDGFVQNHTVYGDPATGATDFSSGNGAGVPGTTTVTLQGASHALITFSMPTYVIGGQTVPTTVQWFFADGRSHPVFAVSQDARATSGNLSADTRTPYGDMAYDGDGVDALVGGFSYGDTYKFYTEALNPEEVTSASGWSDVLSNTIPYAMQWAEPATVDAEMGHVATLPISLSDQGGDTQTSNYDDPPDLFDPRTQSVPGGPLPAYNTYAFQIINDTMPATGPTDSKRLAWGSNFGRVGGFDNYGDTSLDVTQYSRHSDDPINSPLAGSRVSGMLMAYSTFIVLGPHLGNYSAGTVGQTVTSMENAALATLSVTTGSAVTSGPAGVGSAANAAITYTPSGYNPTYAAWEISAAGNAVYATLTPANGYPLGHSVFIIDGYTSAQLPSGILVNGMDISGYYYNATLDTAGQRLWITVDEPFDSAVSLRVDPPTGATPPPTVVAPVITSATSATAQVGVAFTYQIVATNSPTAYGTSSPLPDGLSVNTSTGLIMGTPTTAGVYSITLGASNTGGLGTATLTLTIAPAAVAAPVITSATSATAQVGVPFAYQITATNNPTAYGTGSLPAGLAGLSVDTATGYITGTPTTAGVYSITLGASNAGGLGTLTLTLTVAAAAVVAPVVTSPTSANAQVGVPFSYQIVAINNPTAYGTSSPLPGGLSVDAATGLITGTPTTAGVYSITLGASNTGGLGTGPLTLTVVSAAVATPVITSATSATATVGVAFSYQITATNSPTAYGTSPLPAGLAGLSVDAATGLITGTPTTTGIYTFTVGAANASGLGTATLTLTVGATASLPVVTVVATAPTADLATGAAGVITLTRTGGDLTKKLVVSYKLKGSAANGVDYVRLGGTKRFKPNKTSATIQIVPIGDLEDASSKKLKLVVEPEATYTVGGTPRAVVKILRD